MKDVPTATSDVRSFPRRVFYGWWIVSAGSILNGLAAGTYWTGFSVYFLPVTRDFGLSRAEAVHQVPCDGAFYAPLQTSQAVGQ